MQRLVLTQTRIRLCEFCHHCFGDIDDEYWTSEAGDYSGPRIHLVVRKCGKKSLVKLSSIYANPVMWAAFVEHHIKHSDVLIEVE